MNCYFMHLSTVLGDVVPRVRSMLQETIFTNIRQVTEAEMAGVVWGLYKVACMGPAEELAEGEFYEKIDDMKFAVHKIDEMNTEGESLVSLLLNSVLHCIIPVWI